MCTRRKNKSNMSSTLGEWHIFGCACLKHKCAGIPTFWHVFAHLGYLGIPNKYRQNKRNEASMLASAADSASSHFWTKKQIIFQNYNPPPKKNPQLKHSAYWRHWLSQCVQIIAPIQEGRTWRRKNAHTKIAQLLS